MFIASVFVGGGQFLNLFQLGVFERGEAINKKTSHITLILEEKIMPKTKKAKNKIKIEIETETEKPSPSKIVDSKEKSDFVAPKKIRPMGLIGPIVRKVFRRKAIG